MLFAVKTIFFFFIAIFMARLGIHSASHPGVSVYRLKQDNREKKNTFNAMSRAMSVPTLLTLDKIPFLPFTPGNKYLVLERHYVSQKFKGGWARTCETRIQWPITNDQTYAA